MGLNCLFKTMDNCFYFILKCSRLIIILADKCYELSTNTLRIKPQRRQENIFYFEFFLLSLITTHDKLNFHRPSSQEYAEEGNTTKYWAKLEKPIYVSTNVWL